MDDDLRQVAERYFRGVYGGDSAVVSELAGEDVVCTYPIFASLFGAPAIRGRAAVAAFARRFGARWADARITIHESVAEAGRVVLIWSFRARQREGGGGPGAPAAPEQAWGGITLFRFDAAGKIVAEIGEESAPGPVGRLRTDDPDSSPPATATD